MEIDEHNLNQIIEVTVQRAVHKLNEHLSQVLDSQIKMQDRFNVALEELQKLRSSLVILKLEISQEDHVKGYQFVQQMCELGRLHGESQFNFREIEKRMGLIEEALSKEKEHIVRIQVDGAKQKVECLDSNDKDPGCIDSKHIMKVIKSTLTPEEWLIIDRRYAIERAYEKKIRTFACIARDFNLSTDRIRHIHNRAIYKIKKLEPTKNLYAIPNKDLRDAVL